MVQQAFGAIGESLTRALLGGDFARFASLFALPCKMTPRGDLSYVIQTEPELRTDFELYRGNLLGRGVTDIFRQILEFTLIDPQHVRVRVLTHIMVRAQRIVEPFETHFFLCEQPEGWRIYQIESSGGHINWSLGRAEIRDGAFQPKAQNGRDGDVKA